MKFHVKTDAVILKVNMRKSGADHEERRFVDIKLQGFLTAKQLAPLFWEQQVNTLFYESFWDNDKDHNPLFWSIDRIKLHTSCQNLEMVLLGFNLEGCEAKKFEVAIKAQRKGILYWTMTVEDPQENFLPTLFEYLGHPVSVIIGPGSEYQESLIGMVKNG